MLHKNVCKKRGYGSHPQTRVFVNQGSECGPLVSLHCKKWMIRKRVVMPHTAMHHTPPTIHSSVSQLVRTHTLFTQCFFRMSWYQPRPHLYRYTWSTTVSQLCSYRHTSSGRSLLYIVHTRTQWHSRLVAASARLRARATQLLQFKFRIRAKWLEWASLIGKCHCGNSRCLDWPPRERRLHNYCN